MEGVYRNRQLPPEERKPVYPPPELELAWQCDRFHALPKAGGLLDQPAGLMDNLRQIAEIYKGYNAYINRPMGDDGKWMSEHPAEMRATARVWEIFEDEQSD